MELERERPEALATFTGMRVLRGDIVCLDVSGQIMVETDDGTDILCEFLRISAAAPPPLHAGDKVIYLFDAAAERGYVLGRVEPATACLDASRQIKFEAPDRIEFRCGASSLVMTKDGSITIRGADVTSRASRINKVRGAAVKLN